MLEGVLGSTSAERVLVFLRSRGEGYAREMARFFDTSLRPIQRQLERLEAAGVLWSRLVGRTRLYAFNRGILFCGSWRPCSTGPSLSILRRIAGRF